MFYVVDDKKNLIEAYDKEGVLSLLAQAIQDGSLEGITADSAFISKIKCCVSGTTNQVAFVTQAKYNELLQDNKIETNTYYYITDDTTAEDIEEQLAVLTTRVNDIDIRLGEEANERIKKDKEIEDHIESLYRGYVVKRAYINIGSLEEYSKHFPLLAMYYVGNYDTYYPCKYSIDGTSISVEALTGSGSIVLTQSYYVWIFYCESYEQGE